MRVVAELGIILGERFERAAEAQRRAPMIPIYRLKLWVSLVGVLLLGTPCPAGLQLRQIQEGLCRKGNSCHYKCFPWVDVQ